MSNIVETSNQIELGFDNSQVDLIKNTVAKGASNDELQMFMYLANQYNLDPFKNEIWFMKFGGKTNIMTSRDGYLKYAQMNDEFEGLISFVVREGDIFEIDAADYKISHKFGAKRGQILGAWSRCDRRGKKPFIAYVEFAEYNKKNQIWNSYPSAMIQKVAEVFVLKRAFGINGLVTTEEIATEETPDIIPEDDTPTTNTITQPQQRRMFAIAKGNQGIVKHAIDEKGFEGTADVTRDEYEDICKRIEELVVELEDIEEDDPEVVDEEEDIEIPFTDYDEDGNPLPDELPWDAED